MLCSFCNVNAKVITKEWVDDDNMMHLQVKCSNCDSVYYNRQTLTDGTVRPLTPEYEGGIERPGFIQRIRRLFR